MANKENIVPVELQDFVRDNYAEYGEYINFERVIPELDGLKKVHRRALLGLRNVALNKMTSTVNVIGEINTIHTFGTSSIEQVVADFVRVGTLEGQGSFGIKLIEDVPHSAPRYTKCMLSKPQDDYFFKLLDYCPTIEGEVTIEPEYLLTPIPYCLTVGSLSLGLGVNCRTPAFTYKSLVEAYFKNDPSLLESSFGYKLDKDKSDLQSLWDKGVGSVYLHMLTQRISEEEIVISGSGEIYKPNLKAFREYQKGGNIIIRNESTDKIAIRIQKVKRARVNMEDVFKTAKFAASFKRNYNILVITRNNESKRIIRTIGIKEWLDITIGQYIANFERYKLDRLSELEVDVKVCEFLPIVGKMIIDNHTDEEILSLKGMTEEILSRIKRKTISSLRREDYSKEIQALQNKMKEIKAEDPIKEIYKYC